MTEAEEDLERFESWLARPDTGRDLDLVWTVRGIK